MTDLLIDTSVVIKWFHSDGEGELTEARALRAAHLDGRVDCHFLDLGFYEIGNVLIRALRWSAVTTAQQLEDLRTVTGEPLVMAPDWLSRAALLATRHRLSFYDACWATAAAELRIPLVSADRQLLTSGLAESATSIASRLGISHES